MNKEKEELLKTILIKPDVPYKVSMKSIMQLIERMQPATDDMKEYLISYYSAATRAESQAIRKAKYDSMSVSERKIFDAAFMQCLQNDINLSKRVQLA